MQSTQRPLGSILVMRLPMQLLMRLTLAITLATAAGGCALVTPVQAWEKGILAKPEMSFEGDKLEAQFAEHTYTSKEAASGGAGVGGGGCGCN